MATRSPYPNFCKHLVQSKNVFAGIFLVWMKEWKDKRTGKERALQLKIKIKSRLFNKYKKSSMKEKNQAFNLQQTNQRFTLPYNHLAGK